MSEDYFVHPYIPNAVPETKEAMLREIGKKDALDIYEPIPDHLRFKGLLDVPGPIHSEAELKRHGKAVLRKNADCDEYLSFLGAGVWQHHVPAAVDEVVNRAELLSAYDGMYYTDQGKWQAKWEFASQLAELVDFDVVTMPFYDWGTVLGLALRMATRITGRRRVLCAATTGPERLTVARTMCPPPEMAAHIALETVAYDAATGELDLDDLTRQALRRHGRGLHRDAQLPRHHREPLRRDRRHGPRGRRALHRRRRSHLARRAGRAGLLRRRHRHRAHPAPRRAPELRRRPGRLHGLPRRAGLLRRVPAAPLHGARHRARGRVRLRRGHGGAHELRPARPGP